MVVFNMEQENLPSECLPVALLLNVMICLFDHFVPTALTIVYKCIAIYLTHHRTNNMRRRRMGYFATIPGTCNRRYHVTFCFKIYFFTLQGGSVVHLTAEVLSKVFSNSRLLWVPLSNSLSLEAGVKAQGKGVSQFAGIPEHVTCVTLNNMNEITPLGHFEPDKVPLWTKQGKKLITADR